MSNTISYSKNEADNLFYLNEKGRLLELKVEELGEGIKGSISPDMTTQDLHELDFGIYRAETSGLYQFPDPVVMDIPNETVADNTVPVGYSVLFSKDTDGWRLFQAVKMPEIEVNGIIEEGNENAVSGGEVFSAVNPINDALFDLTPAGINFISELTGSDVDDEDLWGIGFYTETGGINATSTWRRSLKYYEVGSNLIDFKLGIHGNACAVLYDEDKNFIGVIKNNDGDGSTYYTVANYELPHGTHYIRVSFSMAYYATNQIYFKNAKEIRIPKSDVFLETNKLEEKVQPAIVNVVSKFGLDEVPVGTNFISELTGSDVDDEDLWGIGFYTETGSINNSVSWRYSKHKYKLTGGVEYEINVNISGNAKALILNLDGTVRKVLTGTGDYAETFIEQIDEDCFFVTSQNRANPALPTTDRINVVNREPIYPVAITTSNISNYAPPASNDIVRQIYLDTYRAKIKRPIVTIISDDGRPANLDWFVPILDEFGVKATFAVVGKWTRNRDLGLSTNAMSSEELRNLFNDGHDIASHSWTHTANWGTVFTPEEIEEEMSRNKVFLEEITTTSVNMFVSPWGIRNAAIDGIISKYYDANFISGYGTFNPIPLDNYFINRVGFDTSETTYAEKWNDVLKPAIDEALQENNWLVFAIHPQYTQYYSENPNYMARREELRTLLQYCQDNDIEVTTAKKGYEYFKNHVDIGVKRVNQRYYKLGMNMVEENVDYFED